MDGEDPAPRGRVGRQVPGANHRHEFVREDAGFGKRAVVAFAVLGAGGFLLVSVTFDGQHAAGLGLHDT